MVLVVFFFNWASREAGKCSTRDVPWWKAPPTLGRVILVQRCSVTRTMEIRILKEKFSAKLCNNENLLSDDVELGSCIWYIESPASARPPGGSAVKHKVPHTTLHVDPDSMSVEPEMFKKELLHENTAFVREVATSWASQERFLTVVRRCAA